MLAQQRKTFGPMLDWFAEKFESKPKVSVLYGKLKHPPELMRKVRECILRKRERERGREGGRVSRERESGRQRERTA